MGLVRRFKKQISKICKDNYAPGILKDGVVFHDCWDAKPCDQDIYIGNKTTIKRLYDIFRESEDMLKIGDWPRYKGCVLIDDKDRLSAIALDDARHEAGIIRNTVEVKHLRNLYLNHRVKDLMYFLERDFYHKPTNRLRRYCEILKKQIVVCRVD